MAAKVTEQLSEMGDIVDVLKAWEISNVKNVVSYVPRTKNDRVP